MCFGAASQPFTIATWKTWTSCKFKQKCSNTHGITIARERAATTRGGMHPFLKAPTLRPWACLRVIAWQFATRESPTIWRRQEQYGVCPIDEARG